MPSFDGSADDNVHVPEIGDILEEHHDHGRGRALTIQAGLYSGLLGHGVDNALKVQEYDEDGHLILHTTTLDEFEQFMKVRTAGVPLGYRWVPLVGAVGCCVHGTNKSTSYLFSFSFILSQLYTVPHAVPSRFWSRLLRPRQCGGQT
jgi:hypothetical protein